MAKKREAEITFETLKVEGGIIGSEWLGKVALLQAPNQSSEEYRVPSGLQLRDEIVRYWRIASAKWAEFRTAKDSATDGGYEACRKFIPSLLKDVFDFESLEKAAGKSVLGEREFPIPYFALNQKVPVVLGEPVHKLEHLHERYRDISRKRTCFGLLQEYLNACDEALWGIVSNGVKLRIARDNHSLTRPAWIEVDLEQMFEGELFDEFAVLWLVLHESRFGRMDTLPKDCALEVWRDESKNEGVRARDLLRQGVEEAIKLLGQGFLEHPANTELRERFVSGQLSGQDYFRQLLRLVYRFIFLLTIEERNMLHPASADKGAVSVYRDGYSVARLRDRSIRRTQHDSGFDAWESLQPVFEGLEHGQALLGLPALGGLFSLEQCPDISRVKLGNKALMGAVFNLSWMRDDASKSLVRVNWKDMGPEEFGSVYESLLELVPEVSSGGRVFDLKTVAGNERKTTGSYYTPDSLVKLLLDSALEPVIKKVIDSNPADPVKALLQLTVIDPSCGSGHFLIAAAHRIAAHVARLSVDGTPTSSDYAHALRQVITHCIFGTDLNPMALELAKMALWLEAHTPDTPLGFLDHHLVLGNALLGLVSPEDLKQGIPEKAYSPRTGDDKDLCKEIKAKNKIEAKSLQTLLGQTGQKTLGGMEFTLPTNLFEELEGMSDETLEAIELKRQKLEELRQSHDSEGVALAMDLYMAAFLMRKTASIAAEDIPTTRDVTLALRGEPVSDRKVRDAQKVCRAARVNHWPITFPQVFARGGFSCVLGNPPWESLVLQKHEFFMKRIPEIARSSNQADRDLKIEELKSHPDGSYKRRVFKEYEQAKYLSEAESEFCRKVHYPLTGHGSLNTYALFSERIYQIFEKNRGSCGFIVQSGIMTDDSTKPYFNELITNKLLSSIFDFENQEKIFDIDSRMKFALVTIGKAEKVDFGFFLTKPEQANDLSKKIQIDPKDLLLVNPNTKTCPIFRTKADAELIVNIFRRLPILHSEVDGVSDANWPFEFSRVFDMSSDSELFYEYPADETVPLYEGKMVQAYDCRAAGVKINPENTKRPAQPDPSSSEQLQDPFFDVKPQYWVSKKDFIGRRFDVTKEKEMLVFKNVSSPTNRRSMIAAFCPPAGAGHSLTTVIFPKSIDTKQRLLFSANLNSLIFDYVLRSKMGGQNLSYFILYQIPFIPLSSYSNAEIEFVAKRAGYLSGFPSKLRHLAEVSEVEVTEWNEEKRLIGLAELDAFYAQKYGLSRDELLFVLDPETHPLNGISTVTFESLKRQDIAEFGVYKTYDLVKSAWDRFFDANGNQIQPLDSAA